jgi:hypothetical protein
VGLAGEGLRTKNIWLASAPQANLWARYEASEIYHTRYIWRSPEHDIQLASGRHHEKMLLTRRHDLRSSRGIVVFIHEPHKRPLAERTLLVTRHV